MRERMPMCSNSSACMKGAIKSTTQEAILKFTCENMQTLSRFSAKLARSFSYQSGTRPSTNKRSVKRNKKSVSCRTGVGQAREWSRIVTWLWSRSKRWSLKSRITSINICICALRKNIWFNQTTKQVKIKEIAPKQKIITPTVCIVQRTWSGWTTLLWLLFFHHSKKAPRRSENPSKPNLKI